MMSHHSQYYGNSSCPDQNSLNQDRSSHGKGCSCQKCSHHPPYRTTEQFPPPKPRKKGPDVCHGDVVANNINAETVTGKPKTFYIPGDFCTLGEAFKHLSSTTDPEPFGGYKIVLGTGTHVLGADLGKGCSEFINGKCVGNIVKNLTIEAQSWTPVMAHGYIQGTGLSDVNITCAFDQYAEKEGGLGPWDLEICGRRITVRGAKHHNPDFSSLEQGDDLFFRTKTGTILCHKVEKGTCNSVFVQGCSDIGIETDGNGHPEEGEGFWIGNRTHVKTDGNRRVETQDRLEWVGINLSSNKCHPLTTGATGGTYQLKHCHTQHVIKAVGRADNLYPNVHEGTISRAFGENGINLYQSFLGCEAKYFGQGSNELLAGSVFSGNEKGIQIEGGSKIGAVGSSFARCQIGCDSTGSILDYAGCRIWCCNLGLSGLTAHFHSINQETPSLIKVGSPILSQCEIGIRIEDKGHGKNETIRTFQNDIDLRIDGTDYPSLTNYPSGQFENKASAIYYQSHIEEKACHKTRKKKCRKKKAH